jgi:hypothetical protein
MRGRARLDEFIAATLTGATPVEAAATIGVHPSTVRRWANDPDVRRQLNAARREVIVAVVDRLAAMSSEALDTLAAVQVDTKASAADQIRAARAVLTVTLAGRDRVLAAAELDDLHRRLDAIEGKAPPDAAHERTLRALTG